MSAAGPVPPYASSSSNNGPPASRFSNGSGEHVFAHIQDLKAEALADINPDQSISRLCERAEKALSEAEKNRDLRRPDLAFVEYLRSAEIAVEVLPKHPDYIDYVHDRHGEHKLQVLRRRIGQLDDQFESIKNIIINNNTRFGTIPRARQQYVQQQQQQVSGSNSYGGSTGLHKVKPSPSPKPDKLHSRAISQANAGINSTSGIRNPESLDNRFAKLRVLGQAEAATRPDSRGSNGSTNNLSFSMPAADDYGESLGSISKLSNYSLKPQGPRSMLGNGGGPPRPLKMPLDTELAVSLPKPPSPTYSPARNMQTTGNIAPPRHSARSLAGSNNRKSSLIISSAASATTPTASGDYPSGTTLPGNGVTHAPKYERTSAYYPKETCIGAGRLFDYLERFNIMLIDFRSRDEFDHGHVFTRNIICVDPLIMRQGMSADELARKLVLSPDEELDMFHDRDSFDLVVYYDAQTQSDNHLSRPRTPQEVKLSYLYDALCDFNQDKPLKKPPILLTGGISAWTDLIGVQALVATNTQLRHNQDRTLRRSSAPRRGPPKVPKHRREYNPLGIEEEQKWRERAISESVPETTAFRSSSEDESKIDEDEDALSAYPTIDDFNARFPEAGSLGLQSFSGGAVRQAPIPPAKIPQYPAAPSPAKYPPVPARPVPAAPRMSYTGVSDRVVSQNTPTTRSSSQLMPYIPPKYLATNLRLPRTGLVNFGSTCYMNATLQALSATTPLSILFLDDQYRSQVQKDNWKGSRGLLPEIYSNTIRSLWKGDVDCIKPTTLFNFVGRLNSMFRDPGQQQDAQEFFSMVVDVLHEDFNTAWARTPLQVLTERDEQARERMARLLVAKIEWGRYTHREDSFLTSLFYGQQSSRLRCPNCGITSTQYDAWALLQVEIPDSSETTLYNCFRQHFKDELLDEDNQWTCPKCKAPRRAWKKLTMTRAPTCMVVGLKRFKTHPKTGDQRKIHTAVRFPLIGLDMEEFMLPQPTIQEAQEIATSHRPEAKAEVWTTPPYLYDAYAVVRHMGESTRSGHYTAAVRDRARGCWRYFNDQTATDFEPETLSSVKALDNDQAYLVFYQRRSPNEVYRS